MSETIKPGRYRHFKGKEYEVLYIATHSETREKMVVYRALYGERGVWVRPASMWNEVIERDGKTYRRFTYIGEGDAKVKSKSRKKLKYFFRRLQAASATYLSKSDPDVSKPKISRG